jgi:hypothetical protein
MPRYADIVANLEEDDCNCNCKRSEFKFDIDHPLAVPIMLVVLHGYFSAKADEAPMHKKWLMYTASGLINLYLIKSI